MPSPDALAHAILHLLEDEDERHAIRKQAYLAGRKMTWPVVARQYMESFQRACQDRLARPRSLLAGQGDLPVDDELPPLDLSHLLRMTDDVGMLQHAIASVPNYTRRLHHRRQRPGAAADRFAGRAWPASGRRGAAAWPIAIWPSCGTPTIRKTAISATSWRYDRRWLEEFGSKDSHARALWAPGRRVGTLAAGGSAAGGRPAVRAGPAGRPRFHRSAAGGLYALRPCTTICCIFPATIAAQEMRALLAERLLTRRASGIRRRSGPGSRSN